MNKRAIIILGILVALLVVVVALAFATNNKNPSSITSQPGVQYTDNTTGQTINGNLPETSGAGMPGQVLQPYITINGFDNVAGLLNNDNQTTSLKTSLENFLMAHAGLATVTAGVQAGTLVKPNDTTLTFTLNVTKPHATYKVTALLDNDYSLITKLTMQQIE